MIIIAVLQQAEHLTHQTAVTTILLQVAVQVLHRLHLPVQMVITVSDAEMSEGGLTVETSLLNITTRQRIIGTTNMKMAALLGKN